MWTLVVLVSATLIKGSELAAVDTEIYNGVNATENEWPWMAWISRNGAYRCGAVLIHKKWVATAAHCVDRSGTYTVTLGDLDRESSSGDEQTLDITQIELHPDYDDIFLENDIALLRLSANALTSQDNIGKLSRWSDDAIDDQVRSDNSVSCGITGWGYETDNKGYWRLAPILQELSVEVIGNKRCDNFMLGARNPSNICYKAQTDAGPCSGDSGSPLVCRVNNKWTLIGIHSFRMNLDGCRGGAKAATKMSMYTTWINSII